LHHARLNTDRDPELWPFVVPGTSRALRVTCAFFEIVAGFVYTPLLFLRCALTAPALTRRQKLQFAVGYFNVMGFWVALGAVLTYFGWWKPFTIGYIVPVAIAGMFQSFNKYVEHLGLYSDSIMGGTRTVAAENTLGKKLSYSLQHIDHHGTHHRYAKIPYHNLPEATELIYQHPEEDAVPLYHSYLRAAWDMLKHLPDPKTGKQWLEWERQQRAEAAITRVPVRKRAVHSHN
jgi:fatty acid desaturase